MDDLVIRPETPADYHAVAEINARAFGTTEEPLLVAALRHCREHDPTLSLVAELEDRPVGHILFVPLRLTLVGTQVRAACLSPVAVLPERQGKGIGSRLIESGHQALRAKGFDLCLLTGHPGYYPRFGYLPGLGGAAELIVSRAAAAELGPDLEERGVAPGDVPLLLSWWERWERPDDGAFHPGDGLSDWLAYSPAVRAAVFTHDGRPVAYARYLRSTPARILALLAADRAGARSLVGTLARRSVDEEVRVPVHPRGEAAAFFAGLPARERLDPWRAFMMLPLVPCPPFERFRAEVEAGLRPIIRAAWPAQYEAAGV